LAKVLNFDSAGGSQLPQRDKPTDDSLIVDAQTNGAENLELVEEEGDGKDPDPDPIIEQEGDLEGAILSEADRMLHKVYGDYVHQNSGQQLNGGVEDDRLWQDYWRRLIVFPASTYDAPSGAVGHRFIEKLAELLDGVRARKMNAEQFIVFHIVVLQRSRDVKQAKDIQKRIARRMDAWEESKFSMLVQDTERTLESFLSTKRGGEVTTEQCTKTFHRKMLRGDVRGAVRYLTDREKGGILLPGDVNEKSGDSVAEALKSKHPHARIPDASSLTKYPITPNFVDVDICEEAVITVARWLSGSAGLGGTDSHAAFTALAAPFRCSQSETSHSSCGVHRLAI
jgi:hypothetical protein